MRWREALSPVPMQRVAVLAPQAALRELLVQVADDGTVELDEVRAEEGEQASGTMPVAARVQRLSLGAVRPALSPAAPDLDECERTGRLDLIAGEAQVEDRAGQALVRHGVAAFVGWMPADKVAPLAARLAGSGGAVVPMLRPAGAQPPTLLASSRAAREFSPLVQTYAPVPYADLDPSLVAGVAYIVMFGMMFADVGHGLLLAGAALAIRLSPWARLRSLRPAFPFLLGAGLAGALFGSLYGEFFGPTHVVPALWLVPLDHPVTLLVAAVGVGAVLLSGAYILGALNRLREGGWRLAVYAPSGIAGTALFLGLGLAAGGLYWHSGWAALGGGVLAGAGMVAAYGGMLASAGGGAAGAVQAVVELFDIVVRLGSNLVSFARLAAFGLTHAALGSVIWGATAGLWGRGPVGEIAAVVLFLLGNALAFALEGLVAGIQALRLEYYELFSRVFDSEGRPFRPWHVPLTEVSCSPG